MTTFLRLHVNSVEKLEVLVALRRTPDLRISLAALAAQTRLPASIVRRIVGELVASNILQLDSAGEVRLAPKRRTDTLAIEELLAKHELDPKAVLAVLT